MKNRIILALAIAISSFLLWWFSGTSNLEKKSATSSDEIVMVQDEQNKPKISEPATTVGLEQKKEEIVAAESVALETVVEDDQQPFNGISRPSDEAKEILQEAGVLPQDINGEAYVEFDLDSLRALDVGDTFNLESPQTSEMFSAEVTKVDIFDNGDKSVFGRLVGSDGAMHTTVLTVGTDALYGQFTTASGNYVFESKGKHGWLAAKRDLYKSHVEFEAVQMDSSSEDSVEVIAPGGTKE
jgi:hypothetical protein